MLYSTTVRLSLGLLFIAWTTPALAVSPAVKCEAARLKTAAKHASCILKADRKALLKGGSPDLGRCENKFRARLTKIDGKYGQACPDDMDTADAMSRLEYCMAEVPGGSPEPLVRGQLIVEIRKKDQSPISGEVFICPGCSTWSSLGPLAADQAVADFFATELPPAWVAGSHLVKRLAARRGWHTAALPRASADILDSEPGYEFRYVAYPRPKTVVFDDGSTQGTDEWIEDFPPTTLPALIMSEVENDRVLEWNKGDTVHELVGPDGKVWTMFAHDYETAFDEAATSYTPPSGWTQRTRILDSDLSLDSEGLAEVATNALDEIHHLWQHNPGADIDPD